ncbi:MAG: hypothetical protein LIP11_18420 [Clostridiales bacterium]|nr:hypothetical protein [Clostridiales bacterium]
MANTLSDIAEMLRNNMFAILQGQNKDKSFLPLLSILIFLKNTPYALLVTGHNRAMHPAAGACLHVTSPYTENPRQKLSPFCRGKCC